MINGNDFRLRVNGVLLKNSKSSSLSFSNDLVDVTKGITKTFQEVISGRKSGVVSFDSLLDFDNLLEVGASVSWSVGDTWQGNGIITQIQASASSDSVVSYSGTIDVVGPIEPFEVVIEDGFLLLESGDFVLQESGDKIEIDTRTN